MADDGLTYDAMSTPDLVELAWAVKKSPSYRLAAIEALGRRCAAEPNVADELGKIACDAEMQEVRILHLVSLSYVAVANLVRCGTAEAMAQARQALLAFPEKDRSLLVNWLRSGGLAISTD